MSELDTAPKGPETPSNDKSPKGGDPNTPKTEPTLFDKGYGAGIDKGKKQLLEELGAGGRVPLLVEKRPDASSGRGSFE
jgi:hypothetical protein